MSGVNDGETIEQTLSTVPLIEKSPTTGSLRSQSRAKDPAWLGGMPQNIGGALGLHRITGSDISLRVGLTARWNSGTRQDDVVIRFECYSRTTDSDYVRSYNRSGARGQQGR